MNNNLGVYKSAFAQMMVTVASLDDALPPRPPLLPTPAVLAPPPRVVDLTPRVLDQDPPPMFCAYCKRTNHEKEDW